MLVALKRSLLGLLPPTVRGRLRTWRFQRSISTFPTRVVEHTYGKVRLKVFLADPLSEGWYAKDWPDLPELAILRRSRLRPGNRVFDLGAHQGVVALMLAHEVGVTGQVVALEALPHNAEIARKNAALNEVAQVEVIHAAVSDRSGTLTFNQRLNGSLDDGSADQGQVVVPSVTLDELADRFGMPDVVFLDVEGAECLALSSASRVLASPADFFVEVHVNAGLEKLGGSVQEVLSHFPQDQYERLGRAEQDAEFRPLVENDPLFSDRFFLIATRHAPTPES